MTEKAPETHGRTEPCDPPALAAPALCGAPITAGPGAGIPTICKRERPCSIHDNPALNEVRA